jgi:hypothetical protein
VVEVELQEDILWVTLAHLYTVRCLVEVVAVEVEVVVVEEGVAEVVVAEVELQIMGLEMPLWL